MTTAVQPAGGGGGGGLERPTPTGLADVIDTILDKGLVIDAYVRVSLVGIEILTIDARVVVASVDTYLRFAEAVNRLDISKQDEKKGLPELLEDVGEGASKSKTKGAIEAAGEALRDFVGGSEQRRPEPRPSRREGGR
jgi:gas vesicle structural protein